MVTPELAKLADEALVRLASGGDRTALEVLLERHMRSAVSYACTLLSNREDALDAAQTALIRILHELASGWRGRPFKTCLTHENDKHEIDF